METLVTDDVELAAGVIRGGGLVAFPTETVYGLGADVFNAAAIEKVFAAKMRPADNPLIAHIGGLDQIERIAIEITPSAQVLIERFFPGPLTVVLKRFAEVPEIATAGLDTIGIRMPRNETAAEFLKLCGSPVVAPSANISGRPSPTTWRAVLEDLNGRIDCILKGEPTEIGLESTVVDCTDNFPMLLRAGAVSLEELRSVIPETEIFRSAEVAEIRSPGLRHKHYSPRASVVIIENDASIEDASSTAFIGIEQPVGNFGLLKICSTPEEYAHSMFEFFRECDRTGVSTIYCQAVAEQGIGTAIMDRLRRAAELAADC